MLGAAAKMTSLMALFTLKKVLRRIREVSQGFWRHFRFRFTHFLLSSRAVRWGEVLPF